MENNKILIGINFISSSGELFEFEFIVLRDIKLKQLFEGLVEGILAKYKKNNCSEILASVLEAGDELDDEYELLTPENGRKALNELGFITSTCIVLSDKKITLTEYNYDYDNSNLIFKETFPRYNISSRQLTIVDDTPIKIIPPSEPPQKPKLDILMMIIPTVSMAIAMSLGRVLFMSSGVSTMGMIGLSLTMAVVSVVMAIVNYHKQTNDHKEKLKEYTQHYEEYIEKTILKIIERKNADVEYLSEEYPNTNSLTKKTVNVSERLYSRSQKDRDFLTVRLGLSDEVDTLFKVDGEKTETVFSPTKYNWNNDKNSIEVVLFPEKTKIKKIKELLKA